LSQRAAKCEVKNGEWNKLLRFGGSESSAFLRMQQAVLRATDHYMVRTDAGTVQKAEMYSSFDRNVVLHNSRLVPDIAERMIEVSVKCVSMKTLLCEVGGRTVYILTLDAEGFDYAVLKMIDFSVLRPAIICYEHTHLAKADQEAAAKMLADQDYRMTRNNLDTFANRPGFSYGWQGKN
jgi:hypothetical protein